MVVVELSQCQYQLVPRRVLNALTTREPRSGFLIRGQFPDGRLGFADCHPWPEFGDQKVNLQLENLKRGEWTQLPLKRTLEILKWDHQRRQQSSWQSHSQPLENHHLLTDLGSVTPELLGSLQAQGFTTLKIKMSSKMSARDFTALFGDSRFRLRLDYNSSATGPELEDFFSQLPTELLARIQFVEDPMPFDLSRWQSLGRWVPLAIDFEWANLGSEISKAVSAFRFVILKPARQSPQEILDFCLRHHLTCVVTSSLDHPLGIMQALGLTQELRQNPSYSKCLDSVCGFLSFDLYEENEFLRGLDFSGPALEFLDFTSQLHALEWTPMGSYEI